MRKFVLGLAGFAVIAFAASLCYADDGEAEGMSYSLNLNELFNMPVQEGEKPAEAKLKWSLWGQLRADYSDGTYSAVAGRPTGGNEGFRAARFRFLPKVTYEWLSFGCQYETMSTLTLLDFWVNMKHSDKLQWKMGQFIPPFGYQRPWSPYKLLCDYSQAVGYFFGPNGPLGGGWGNLRDSGGMFHGTLKLGEGPKLNYAAGIFVGEGAGVQNSDPAWNFFMTAKLKLTPDVELGVSYEDGSRQATIGGFSRNVNRDRVGLSGKLTLLKDEKTKVKKLIIQSEYIAGNSNVSDYAKHGSGIPYPGYQHNKSMQAEGWYFQVGLEVMPKKVRLIGQIDILDIPAYNITTDVRAAAGVKDNSYTKRRQYGLGFIWFICKHCKMKIWWEQTQNEGRAKIKKISGSEHRACMVFGVNF
jgi:hypothetical protein